MCGTALGKEDAEAGYERAKTARAWVIAPDLGRGPMREDVYPLGLVNVADASTWLFANTARWPRAPPQF